MKIYISKASEPWGLGKVNEYSGLQECIETLLNNEKFGTFEPAVIVTKPCEMIMDRIGEKAEYEVIIYDTYIE